jgi:hypothetical protein
MEFNQQLIAKKSASFKKKICNYRLPLGKEKLTTMVMLMSCLQTKSNTMQVICKRDLTMNLVKVCQHQLEELTVISQYHLISKIKYLSNHTKEKILIQELYKEIWIPTSKISKKFKYKIKDSKPTSQTILLPSELHQLEEEN